MDLEEIGWGGALSELIGPKTAQDFLNTKMNIQIP
jgi:hypothetical protein